MVDRRARLGAAGRSLVKTNNSKKGGHAYRPATLLAARGQCSRQRAVSPFFILRPLRCRIKIGNRHLTLRSRSQSPREKKELADKPGSVWDNHSSGMRVTTHLKRPTRKHMWATCAVQIRGLGPLASLFGLAPGGVCHATECYHRRGALLPHHFTLTAPTPTLPRKRGREQRESGGLFSVALSVGSRPPGVTWRLALWSPDFPPRLRAAIAWPTPPRMVGTWASTSKENMFGDMLL